MKKELEKVRSALYDLYQDCSEWEGHSLNENAKDALTILDKLIAQSSNKSGEKDV